MREGSQRRGTFSFRRGSSSRFFFLYLVPSFLLGLTNLKTVKALTRNYTNEKSNNRDMRLKLVVKYFSQIYGKDLSTFQVQVLFVLSFFLNICTFYGISVIQFSVSFHSSSPLCICK